MFVSRLGRERGRERGEREERERREREERGERESKRGSGRGRARVREGE